MKILIAEDDPVTREILHSVIVRLGHDCLVTRNGTEAWAVFQGTHVDVVISDCMMPVMDGLELCRRIREHPGDNYPYFIFLTLLEHGHDLLSGMKAGADDYLTKPLNTEELQMRLIAASRVTSLHSQLADKRQQLEQLNQRLFEQSREDPLTGIGNRLKLREDFESLSARTARYDQEYGVILFDVDHFKRYNDSYGHLAGDKVLKAIADVTLTTMRGADSVYRFGGEEFLVLLPAQSVWSSQHVAERLRQAVEFLGISHEKRFVTVSIGITARRSGDAATPEDLLKQADNALYKAKSTGRNRVSVYKRGA